MDWTPDPSVVRQTVSMLQALRDPTSSSHPAAIKVLQSDAQNPVFVLHVVHVFSHARDIPVDLRQLAGLIVKNYIILADKFPALDTGVQSLLKRSIIMAVSDPETSVRGTATNLIGGMSRQLPVEIWSDIVETIIQNLSANSGNMDCVDGSLTALRRLSEDSGEKMAVDVIHYPLVRAVPVLFAACKSNVVRHRQLALDALISLLFVIFDPPPLPVLSPGVSVPPSLSCFISEYLSTISYLAADQDPSVRTSVCQALVLIMTSHADTLTGLLDQICSFMLTATADASSSVATEAAEFWSALADVITAESIPPESDHVMVKFLLKSLPVLLSRMVLTAEQVERDRAERAAEISGDKEVTFGKTGKSIYHHRTKDTSHSRKKGQSDDDNEESGDVSGEWTVRKQCAGVFDTVCSSGALLPSQILPIALPVAKSMMQSAGDVATPAWVYMEAGILIIGALANGCSSEMEPHLPVLLPFFCQQITCHEFSEVRSISCWVLGRYSEWIIATLFSVCDSIESEDGGGTLYRPKLYDPASNCYDLSLSVLLPAMMDKSMDVQSAALSAVNALLASITGISENEVNVLLSEDRVGFILDHIASASQLTVTGSYGLRNCLILCDLIAALCEAAGDLVGTAALIPRFLPFIMHQYLNVFNDNSAVYLFPVMEAVTAVLGVVGMHVHVYAMPLLKRSVDIAGNALQQEQDERSQRGGEDFSGSRGSFHLDFVVCAFDIIGALSECLVSSSEMDASMLQPSNFSMLLSEAGVATVLGQMIVASLSLQAEPDVLQSSFALCGELFRTAIISLLPVADSGGDNIVEQMLGRIVFYISQPEIPLAVVSNALWATGEALIRLRHAPGGVSDAFLAAVLPVLLHRLHEHVGSVVNYGMDRYGPLATSVTTPAAMDPEDDLEIFLESLGPHENVFLQNAAITLGRIAILNMPLFLHFLEQSSSTTVSYFQCWCSALSLVSSDAKERNHAFMGLLGALQTKPDLLQLVVPNSRPQQCVTDSATLFLFGTALAWRRTSNLQGEDTDVFLALRCAIISLRSQLSEYREKGEVVDKRLVGIFALFKFLADSFSI